MDSIFAQVTPLNGSDTNKKADLAVRLAVELHNVYQFGSVVKPFRESPAQFGTDSPAGFWVPLGPH